MVTWSELLRRSGFPSAALKILFVYVRGRGKNYKSSSVLEKEEYAASLIALKAIDEAILLLEELQPFNSPKTYLFFGFAHINQWDYSKAVLVLEKFLSFKTISDYDRAIGMTNFLASKVALVDENPQSIPSLEVQLEETILKMEDSNYKVLSLNLREIQVQLIIKKAHFFPSNIKSQKTLATVINDPKSKENLFVKKWQIIASKPKDEKSSVRIKQWMEKLKQLQKEALETSHTETVRDIDFHLGEYAPHRLEKVFWGTPYKAFRQKILLTYKLNIQNTYIYRLTSNHEKSPKNRFLFDYKRFGDLKKSSLLVRGIHALCCDFYKSQNRYALHAKIFPGEFFNPQSSFNKVYQAIHRLRRWLTLHKIPLEIHQHDEEYFFVGDVDIKIYREDQIDHASHNKYSEDILKLRGAMEDQKFSLGEAMAVLQYNERRQTQRIFKILIDDGILMKSGKGKNTLYHFLS